jgi:hypothetical protein
LDVITTAYASAVSFRSNWYNREIKNLHID